MSHVSEIKKRSALLTAEFMQKDFVLEKTVEGNGDSYLCFRRQNAHGY